VAPKHEAHLFAARADDLEGMAAGMYAESTVLLSFTAAVEVLGIAWTAYNYFKMLTIKRLLRPRTETISASAKLQFVAPPLYDDGAVTTYKQVHASGLLRVTHAAAVLLNSRGKHENDHHKLFGTAGDRGAQVLLLSIKFNTWFLIAGCTFCFTSIVFPDMASLSSAAPHPDAMTEFLVYGAMGMSFVLMLIFVIPPTFAMFNLVTSIEGFKQDWAIKKAMGIADATPTHGHHH